MMKFGCVLKIINSKKSEGVNIEWQIMYLKMYIEEKLYMQMRLKNQIKAFVTIVQTKIAMPICIAEIVMECKNFTFPQYQKKPHVVGCPYGKGVKFNPSNYAEDKFDFQSILTNLTSSTNNQNRRAQKTKSKISNNILTTPRTIGQIYNLCKSFHHTHAYNGFEIWKMLIDDRSIDMYSNGIFGFKIIEAKCKKPMFYNPSASEINLLTSISGNEYNLILKFEDTALFKTIKNEIYPNRDRIIVVAAEWESSEIEGNTYQTIFLNRKQLKFI